METTTRKMFRTNKKENKMEKYDLVNSVYKTRDLSIFNQMKGNRPANPKHVYKIAESMKDNGVLQNPIIVNKNMTVIDGQHRLLAAKKAETFIYFIIVNGYDLSEIHTLNLNQKNWTSKDFMDGYAEMNIKSYVQLQLFSKEYNDFNLTSCISLLQNTSGSTSRNYANKYRTDQNSMNQSQVFEEGTWLCGDFDLAESNADKIRSIKPYYNNYNKGRFVGVMIGLLNNSNFVFNDFIHKLNVSPIKLEDCGNVNQFKLLIEEIYNYKRRQKINLRY